MGAFGNMVEELAASNGFTAIEELLFSRRMQRAPARSLASFFDPQELVAASQDVPKEVLAPFLTQLGETSEGEEEPESWPAEILFGARSADTPTSSQSQGGQHALGRLCGAGDARFMAGGLVA